MASGMAVLEFNLPSGYYVQQQRLDSYVKYARVRNLREARYQEKKLEMYFDYVSPVLLLGGRGRQRQAVADGFQTFRTDSRLHNAASLLARR